MASIHALVAAVLLVGSAPTPQSVASVPQPLANKSSSAVGVERVEVKTEDKRVLIGSYWGPKDQKGSAPAALLVHDAGGSREGMVEIADRLAKQGFAVLAIDLRSHGESLVADEKGWDALSEDERGRVWPFALRDLKAAAGWIGAQPGVHASNISLLGDRAGCTLVTRYASRDENVRSMVLLDPQVDRYGFNLAEDIAALAGLPTYIAVTKETQPKAQSLAESGERANDGNKFIEIAVFKGAAVMPATDKAMVAGIAKFMASKAMPKKAER